MCYEPKSCFLFSGMTYKMSYKVIIIKKNLKHLKIAVNDVIFCDIWIIS